MHHFHINEFVVQSDLALPCDAVCRSRAVGEARRELRVRRGSLRDLPCLMRHFKRQLSYDVGDGVLVEPTPGLQMHINAGGDVVTLDVADRHLALASAWVIGAALPICTLFQGGLPLHGAGLEVEGRTVGIMAPSGSGKSTLLWALLEQGARFANDDCVAVALHGDGPVMAMPSVSGFPKLHRAVLDRSGVDMARCEPAPPHQDEFWVRVEASRRLIEPQPLAALFVLQPSARRAAHHNAVAEVVVEVVAQRVARQSAARLLLKNLHGVWLLDKQLDGRKLANRCQTLAASTPIYALKYPKRFEALPVLAQAIRRLSEEPAEGIVEFRAQEHAS